MQHLLGATNTVWNISAIVDEQLVLIGFVEPQEFMALQ